MKHWGFEIIKNGTKIAERLRMQRFIVMVYLMAGLALFAQNQQWVVRYNGPANVVDGGLGIVVDEMGNVYVTGRSGNTPSTFECTTIKYSATGVERWIRKYHGPVDSNYTDTGWDIAYDGLGNLYVAAASRDSITGDDIAIIKYDTSGNQHWVARYNGPGNDYDWPFEIEADIAGNVYVTGRSVGAGTGFDYVTIKYDSAGKEMWVRRYNGTGNSSDEAYSIAVDQAGNVYVTGTSTGAGTGLDFATIKYSPSGDERWVQRYNSSGEMDEFGTTLSIDRSGNVYITGGSWKFMQGVRSDYVTIKYDSSGNEKWVVKYAGPQDDVPEEIVVGRYGGVYVTGYSWGSSSTKTDYLTVKYDTSGNEQWVRRYDGPAHDNDQPEAITIDRQENVYVTGKSRGLKDDDYATLVYDSAGNQLTLQRYDGPNSSGWPDAAQDIVADGGRNFYVTGFSGGINSCYDFATIKYSLSGVVNQNCPDRIPIYEIYPNPFRSEINIKFNSVADNNWIGLKIYDASGRLVRHFSPSALITWDGRDDFGNPLPSAVYFLIFATRSSTVTGKVVKLDQVR